MNPTDEIMGTPLTATGEHWEVFFIDPPPNPSPAAELIELLARRPRAWALIRTFETEARRRRGKAEIVRQLRQLGAPWVIEFKDQGPRLYARYAPPYGDY